MTIKNYQTRGLAKAKENSINIEERTAEFVFSSGAKGLRRSWDGSFFEQLSMERESIDLTSFIDGPLLIDHDATSVNNVIGRVIDAKIENGLGIARVRFGKDEISNNYFSRVCDGMLPTVSIGYRVHEYEDVSEKDNKGPPTYLVTRWEPLELSLVSIPMDNQARLRSQEVNNDNNREEEMTKKKEEVLGDKETRAIEIYDVVLGAGLDGAIAKRFIGESITVDSVRGFVDDIKKKVEADKQTATVYTPSVRITADERDTFRESAVSFLEHRVDPSAELKKRAKEFTTFSLFDLARECLPRGDREGSRSDIVSRAIAHSDLGVIMLDWANARLKAGYTKEGIRTFEPLVTTETLSDYRVVNELRFDESASDLSHVPAGSEYTYGNFGASSGISYSLAKFGKVFRITEECLIDDRFNAIAKFFTDLGNLSGRLEEKLFYQELTGNTSLMDDGKPVFDDSHNNISKKEVCISDEAIEDMMEGMKRHKVGKEYILTRPKYLIMGFKQERYYNRYVNITGYYPQGEEGVKLYQRTFTPIITQQLAESPDWYCMSDPNFFPSIKQLKMEGVGSPKLQRREGFSIDAIEIKVKHITGFRAVDYRGLWRNKGLLPVKKER